MPAGEAPSQGGDDLDTQSPAWKVCAIVLPAPRRCPAPLPCAILLAGFFTAVVVRIGRTIQDALSRAADPTVRLHVAELSIRCARTWWILNSVVHGRF